MFICTIVFETCIHHYFNLYLVYTAPKKYINRTNHMYIFVCSLFNRKLRKKNKFNFDFLIKIRLFSSSPGFKFNIIKNVFCELKKLYIFHRHIITKV